MRRVGWPKEITKMNVLKVKRRIESPQTGLIGNISLLRVSEEIGVAARVLKDESRLSHPDMNPSSTDGLLKDRATHL